MLDILSKAPDTCTLDVADRGKHTLQQISELVGTTKQFVSQVGISAVESIRDMIGVRNTKIFLDKLGKG